MIPYVEIKDKYTLKSVGLIEPQECWFELSYQDVGEFEVYCKATSANMRLLHKGRYVTLPNKRFIWVITSLRYTNATNGTPMLLAHGYECKWLLNKRCILTPKELSGTITSAVYGLVNHNLGTGANADRKIVGFTVDTNELLIDISGTQAPRGNLLEFTNQLLKQYNCGSTVEYVNGVLKYRVFTGDVKTNSVRFTQSLDNLISSERFTDDTEKATSALVVSTVDEVDYTKTYDIGLTGIDRAEVLVESNVNTKYEDANGVEKETTPTSSLYQGWLTEEGKKALAERITKEEINGEIDVINSIYKFDEHYFLGDMVRVQDEYFGFFVDPTITKYTFKQDATRYGEEAEYGG
jgi:hypothetical protein